VVMSQGKSGNPVIAVAKIFVGEKVVEIFGMWAVLDWVRPEGLFEAGFRFFFFNCLGGGPFSLFCFFQLFENGGGGKLCG